MIAEFTDYYDLLEVSFEATTEEVHRAYKRAVLKYHPDVSSDKNADHIFREVTKAYQTLKDPSKRASYDERRKKKLVQNIRETVKEKPKQFKNDSPNFIHRLMAAFTIRWATFPDNFGYRHLALDETLADMSIRDLQSRLILSRNPHVQKHAIRALRLKKSKQSILAMIEALHIKDDFVCREVIRHLEGLPVKMGINQVIKVWGQLGESSRWTAVELFRTIPKKKLVSYIDVSVRGQSEDRDIKELIELL